MSHRERILIFQIGSLGDTVIAMPCYREIVRRHPFAERFLLTNFPSGKKMVQAEALLAPCHLIDGSVEYPMPLRGAHNILDLYRRLKALKVDVLYYLSPEKRVLNLIRHYLFFKACGIGEIRGAPWTPDLRFPRETVPRELWESEASRLLRTIVTGREAGPPEPRDRSLDLSVEERAKARLLLTRAGGLKHFIAVSVGGKFPINDWGNDNWLKTLSSISTADPELGAVFVGSADEWNRNEMLAAAWVGPKLNSCGLMTPRETAALIEQAELFLGHDTGTLHLAAAVGTRIVGVYSAREVPGKWFSDRPGDRFFYDKPPCFGCGIRLASECHHSLVCISAHRVKQVAHAVKEELAELACL